jgi:hypothetical protein
MAEPSNEAVREARKVVDALPGMKEREIARLGPCVFCGKPLLVGDLAFRVLTMTRAFWDRDRVLQQAGLQMQLGSAALAQVMGPDADLAKVVDGPVSIGMHDRCYLEKAGIETVAAFEKASAGESGDG